MKSASIKPLFLVNDDTALIGNKIVSFAKDDYNKAIGEALIDAKNDAEAISTFLFEFRESKLTLQMYAKEVERLLLWCIHIGKLNISSLRRNHLADYFVFLENPEPKSAWLGPKFPRRLKDGSANPKWRPFAKSLGKSTIRKIRTILDSFFNYLVQTNYLTGNPLAVDKRRRKRVKERGIIDRYLEQDEINAIFTGLSRYPAKTVKQKFNVIRARYIVFLLFYTGMRIAEAANHSMGDFMQREGNWFLRVTGKGEKERDIPVPDELLDALSDFRVAIQLPSPEPKFREPTPLIPMQNCQQAISTRRIDQILKWAFHLAADELEIKHPRKASKLRQASAHWLRHSYVTYLLDTGAPLKVAQENAGHSDVSTTMHYRHVAQTDRHEATRDLSIVKKTKKNNNV